MADLNKMSFEKTKTFYTILYTCPGQTRTSSGIDGAKMSVFSIEVKAPLH